MNGQMPYEAFHGIKPSISQLKPLGGKRLIHIEKAQRPAGSKLLPRAEKDIFVGYTKVNHHYRIFILEKNQVAVSADVKFSSSPIEKIYTVPVLVELEFSGTESNFQLSLKKDKAWINQK